MSVVWRTGRIHLETNLSSAVFICFISSCLSVLHSLSYTMFFFYTSDSELVSCYMWMLVSHSPIQPLHYPRRLFQQQYLWPVPVYVFLPKTACIPEQTTNPTISCSHNAPFIVHIQIKSIRNYKLQTMKTGRGMIAPFFGCRCRIPQALYSVIFIFPFWKWATPNICSTEGCPSTETLINHTRAVTIIANSLPLVITTLAEIQQRVCFRSTLHHAHPLLRFSLTDLIPATAWFIALQVQHFPSQATFPSYVSYSSAAASLSLSLPLSFQPCL